MPESPKTIHNLEAARLGAYKNEIALDAKTAQFEDPVKFRMGAFKPTGHLAIISGDRLSGDFDAPRRDERVFFGVRHDDDYPKDVEAFEFFVNITDPGEWGNNDPHQKVRLRLTADKLELFGRTVQFAQASQRVSRFYTDGGRFCFNFQDDTGQPSGIVYDTLGGSPDEGSWVPVGKVRIDPL